MRKSSIIITFVIVLILYTILGSVNLNLQKETISGNTGKVWTASQRAVEVLGRLEQQVTVYLTDRQDLIDKITSARNNILAAQESGNLEALNTAQNDAQLAINAILEAYPDVDLTGVQTSLMDETAGSINRIVYARNELIDSQVSFNQTRVLFFISGLFFPRVEVLGENYSAEESLPASTFGE